MQAIADYTFHITNYLYHYIRSLCHANGRKVAEIYTENAILTKENHGSILNFNLLDSDGNYIGFNQVLYFIALF